MPVVSAVMSTMMPVVSAVMPATVMSTMMPVMFTAAVDGEHLATRGLFHQLKLGEIDGVRGLSHRAGEA